MTNSIKAYNSKVSNKSWKIQGRNHSILLSLSQASDRVIRLLEDHYSTTRHSEGALTMDQLSYCEWGVGSSRIPEGQINTPTMWKMIMTVTAGAIEEFASDLARRRAVDWYCGHVLALNIVGCLALSLCVVPRGASCHSGLQPKGRVFRRGQESQTAGANVEAASFGAAGRLLCVRLRGT